MDSVISLEIRQFGPIDHANIIFDKYTVLIGKHGSGKSTIAKLFSLFTWLEKSLVRHILSPKYIMQYSRFKNKYCEFHKISSYFKPDSYIFYNGAHYLFTYDNEKFDIVLKDDNEDFNVSKVMYVPAERNFLSATDNSFSLKRLSPAVQTFLVEFDKAKLAFKNGYVVPINGVSFEYDALNKISWIKGNDYKVRLFEASSGFQSVLPLMLVSRYLSEIVSGSLGKEELSQKELDLIHKEIEKIMGDESLNDEVKYAMAKQLSSRFSYSNFVNIVEEIEQNLYPESQKDTLYELLRYTNETDSNRLLLTTHSPYIISYFTIAVKAWQLKQNLSDERLLERIYQIVPIQSMVSNDHLRIYELKDSTAIPLGTEYGIPSDDNVLNNNLALTNEMMDVLFEIEEECGNE